MTSGRGPLSTSASWARGPSTTVSPAASTSSIPSSGISPPSRSEPQLAPIRLVAPTSMTSDVDRSHTGYEKECRQPLDPRGDLSRFIDPPHLLLPTGSRQLSTTLGNLRFDALRVPDPHPMSSANQSAHGMRAPDRLGVGHRGG